MKIKEEFQRSSQKEERGITLVALVITIVILIILAVVTINFAFGDNGLISQAEDARDYQANADAMDSKLLNDATEYIDGIIGGSGSGGDNPSETTKSEVEEAKESGDTFEDTTTVKDDLDNDVTIPGGFHVAEDSGIRVEEGIVIEDDAGNQFVWIPVGEYNVSESINAEGNLTNNLSRRTFTSSEATEIDGDNSITDGIHYFFGEGNNYSIGYYTIDKFKESATKYKGFYIGRYEQGISNVCKSGVNAYTNITLNNSKLESESMYSENEFVTSELISSYAWDTALNFICQNNEDEYMLATSISNLYGNMSTNNKELTGKYEYDIYCNIHDFLGNCLEWTTEYCSFNNYPSVVRGGSYTSSTATSSSRTISTTSYSYDDLSFRVQLYIK